MIEHHQIWKSETSTVRVLPSRGRLLDVEIGGHGALWSPEAPPLDWCLGGERLWFGPEPDWHWQKFGAPDFALIVTYAMTVLGVALGSLNQTIAAGLPEKTKE